MRGSERQREGEGNETEREREEKDESPHDDHIRRTRPHRQSRTPQYRKQSLRKRRLQHLQRHQCSLVECIDVIVRNELSEEIGGDLLTDPKVEVGESVEKIDGSGFEERAGSAGLAREENEASLM